MTAKILDRKPVSKPHAYDADLYGWVEDQVVLLRAGKVDSIDVSHIMQELEELGRSEFNKLVSVLRVVLLHLLKWDHQSDRRSRSWVLTIEGQRDHIESEVKDSPSLSLGFGRRYEKRIPKLGGTPPRETSLPLATFPEKCPYSWEDVTLRSITWDDDLPYER